MINNFSRDLKAKLCKICPNLLHNSCLVVDVVVVFQIGVSPVIPVSPPRSLPASRQRLHLPSSTQQDVS